MSEDDILLDRSLIDAARPSLGPTAIERANLRRAVMASVAGGAVAATTVAAGANSSAPTGAALASWTSAKVLLGTVVGSALIGAAAWVGLSASPPPAPIERAPVRAPLEVPASAPAPAAQPLAVEREAVAEPVPTEVEPAQPAERRRRVHAPATTSAEPVPSASDLAVETALLRDAHRASSTGDTARALTILDDHARRFPSGVLAEERSAARVLALCAGGQDERARAEADRFVRAYPRSMHVTRVRACASSAE